MTAKRVPIVCVIALLFVAPGCGTEAKPVPDVAGDRLDVAQEKLDDAGLGYEVIGGGTLGVVVRSHWQVCEQRPRPGRRAKSVELVVERSCPRRHAKGTVPDVTGLRLDVAERQLTNDHLPYDVYDEGLGDVVIESNWTVCEQYPEPGEPVEDAVDLYVEHFCDDDD